MRVIVVRDGSAFFLSEFGRQVAKAGEVVLLGSIVLCGKEPEGRIITTTLYVDTDHVVDVMFQRHTNLIADRLDAREFTDTLCSGPAQILYLGEAHAGLLMSWLDEVTAISVDEQASVRFHCVQALRISILDVIDPYVHVSPVRVSKSHRARSANVATKSRPPRYGTKQGPCTT